MSLWDQKWCAVDNQTPYKAIKHLKMLSELERYSIRGEEWTNLYIPDYNNQSSAGYAPCLLHEPPFYRTWLAPRGYNTDWVEKPEKLNTIVYLYHKNVFNFIICLGKSGVKMTLWLSDIMLWYIFLTFCHVLTISVFCSGQNRLELNKPCYYQNSCIFPEVAHENYRVWMASYHRWW